MALDQTMIGTEYPPLPVYEVSRAKIREFADAIKDTNPVYRDPDAARAIGHPDVVAPPTFVTIINIKAIEVVVEDPRLGLDYSRVVHGTQTFTYHRPIVAGDRLVGVTHIDDIRARAGNDFLTIRGEINAESGERVVTTVATLVARGVAEEA